MSIVGEAAGESVQPRVSAVDYRVKAAIDLVTANLSKPLTLSRIAREVNLSVSHLSHLFRTETGQSPGTYLMQLRMQKAAELLASSLLSVKEIMDAVGFQDKSNFVRSFKKAYRAAPSTYREKSSYHVLDGGRNRKID